MDTLSNTWGVTIPVTITRQRTFSDKMTGLTTLVANLLGAGLVVFPPPLLEDLAKALDDEHHLLIVELGGVDGDPTRCTSYKNHTAKSMKHKIT